MTGNIYCVRSSLEIGVDCLEDIVENEVEIPDAISELSISRRGNIIEIESEPADDSISEYTPTAAFKGRVEEKELVDPEEDDSGGIWGQQEEEEEPVEKVPVASFKGSGESVLYNQALQYEMFDVIEQIAQEANEGVLEALVVDDDGLRPVRIVNGEYTNADVEIISEQETNQADWVSNV